MNKFSVGHLADCGGRAMEVYDASDVDRILDIRRGEINEERQDVDRLARRIAELEKALRWHVPMSHDKFCDIQEGKSQCNCGFDLLNSAL